jgi:hypothetical protein
MLNCIDILWSTCTQYQRNLKIILTNWMGNQQNNSINQSSVIWYTKEIKT